MRILAYLLFGSGVMLGIAAGAKLPADGTDFPDTLPIFMVGAILAAIGIVLWRIDVRKEQKAAELPNADKKNPAELIHELIAPTQQLNKNAQNMSAEEIATNADGLLTKYVLPFAEVRNQVVTKFGMGVGAEILITIAFGERMLNRVWTAAADGHQPEAVSCLPEALVAFEQADKMLQQAPDT